MTSFLPDITSGSENSTATKEYIELMMKIDLIERNLPDDKKAKFQIRRNQYLKLHLKEVEEKSQEKNCFSAFLSWFG